MKLNKKAELERQLKAVEGELDELESGVLTYFEEKGIDRVTVDGRTLYPRRELHTSKVGEVSTEIACKTLKKLGLSDYVGTKVNTQGLSAWVREQEAGGMVLNDLRENFAGAFNIFEVFKVGHTKSETKRKRGAS